MPAAESTYRGVLKIPDFRLLIVGATASQMGDWLYNVALLVYVFDRTHSAQWVAAATMVRLLPLAVIGPIGGIVADRYDRISVVIGGALVQWAVMIAITITVALRGPALPVILLAGLNTAFAAPSRPATLASLPTLVGEAGLAPANALLHSVQDVSIVAGPALGAVIIAVGSPTTAFAFNALSFLLAAIVLSSIKKRVPGVPAEAVPSAWTMFADGMRAVRDTPYVAFLTAITFFGCFTYGAQTVQLIVYVHERLGQSSDGYGYLLAATGIGGVLGATVSRRLASRSRIAIAVIVSSVLFTGTQLMFAANSFAAIAILIAVVSGLAMVVSDVVSETAMCRATSADVMGRVFGSIDGICVSGMVLGALVAAPVLHATGLRSSMVILGVFAVGGTVACLPVLLRLDRATSAAAEALAPVVAVLRQLSVFTGASASALERLAAAATELRVGAGMTVIRQGDPADAFYVCTDGTLQVTSRGERGRRERELRQLSSGSYFGEIGLIEGIPRTATVRAVTDTTLLRIDGTSFIAALTEEPAGMLSLAEGAVRGLAVTHPSLANSKARELLASSDRGGQPAMS